MENFVKAIIDLVGTQEITISDKGNPSQLKTREESTKLATALMEDIRIALSRKLTDEEFEKLENQIGNDLEIERENSLLDSVMKLERTDIRDFIFTVSILVGREKEIVDLPFEISLSSKNVNIDLDEKKVELEKTLADMQEKELEKQRKRQKEFELAERNRLAKEEKKRLKEMGE